MMSAAVIQQVLVVEDDPLIAADVEQALTKAGYQVCGVASSEEGALEMAGRSHPDFAVLDVNLDPGDGRNVACELARRYNTKILMATAEDPSSLNHIGAEALLPKPYDTGLIPLALKAVETLANGGDPGILPDHMTRLD